MCEEGMCVGEEGMYVGDYAGVWEKGN